MSLKYQYHTSNPIQNHIHDSTSRNQNSFYRFTSEFPNLHKFNLINANKIMKRYHHETLKFPNLLA